MSAHLRDDLVEWINRRLVPPGTAVRHDTLLFEDGLIDSIRILKLIAWVERETGRRIPDHRIRMDHFRTPDRIVEVFGEPAPREAAPCDAAPCEEAPSEAVS